MRVLAVNINDTSQCFIERNIEQIKLQLLTKEN